MSVWKLKSKSTPSRGAVFRRTKIKFLHRVKSAKALNALTPARGKYRAAFAGLFLFTLVMYLRPQEVWPDIFGALPLAKFAAIGSILVYLYSKASSGEAIMIWPIEMKMLAVMWVTGFVLMPLSASPGDSFTVLFDTFIKTLIIFVLLINLVDTRERLRSLLKIMVLCGFLYSIGAINTYLSGTYGKTGHDRIQGWGNMLNNPNDLASVLTLMVPFAIVFIVLRKGWMRIVCLVAALTSSIAILLTFSRSGFIGLVASTGWIVWKLAHGRRLRISLAALIIATVVFFALPGSYKARLSTIVNPQEDATHSAQERQMLMRRAAELAVRHSIVGLGIGNFHIYSYRELVAHNSYLETAAELGLIGLIAYLTIIFAPIRSLARLQRETGPRSKLPDREIHVMSVCFQASFLAYIVYGFFGSIQYLNFLYFSVAYAVTLRQIHAAEIRETQENRESNTHALVKFQTSGLQKGKLWKPQRLRLRKLAGEAK